MKEMSEITTREASPVKPQDHKPAKDDLVKVEYGGVKFKVKKGALGSLRVLDQLERGQITSALRSLVGDDAFERFLEVNPDADADSAGKLLEAIGEKAGVKN